MHRHIIYTLCLRLSNTRELVLDMFGTDYEMGGYQNTFIELVFKKS